MNEIYGLTLTFLLAVFIILPIQVPEYVTELIDNLFGRVVLLGVAVSLLFYQPVLGAMALVAVYELFKRTGVSFAMMHTATEKNKEKHMKQMNPQRQVTLEEKAVAKARADCAYKNHASESTVKPCDTDIRNASVL